MTKILGLIFVLVFIATFEISDTEAAAQIKDAPQAVSTSGDISSIYGLWKAGTVPDCAKYGVIILEPDKISWRPANEDPPTTTASYSVQNETPGVVFRGLHHEYITTQESNTRERTFLLKLENFQPKDYYTEDYYKKYGEYLPTYIRVVVDSDPPGIIDFIEYYGIDPKPKGWGHFHFGGPLESIDHKALESADRQTKLDLCAL